MGVFEGSGGGVSVFRHPAPSRVRRLKRDAAAVTKQMYLSLVFLSSDFLLLFNPMMARDGGGWRDTLHVSMAGGNGARKK